MGLFSGKPPADPPPSCMEKASRGVCSVCSKDSHTLFRSTLTSKSICDACLMSAANLVQKTNEFLIRCPCCSSTNGVRVVYEGAIVNWAQVSDHRTGYYPSKMEGSWSTESVPKSVSCLSCGRGLPVWVCSRLRP